MDYSTQIKDDKLIFKFSADIQPKLALLVEDEIYKRLEGNSGLTSIVFEVMPETIIGTEALRFFANLGIKLRKDKKTIYVLKPGFDLRAQLKTAGLENLLLPIKSLDEIKKTTKTGRKSIDVNFLNPFITGTLETLKIQCSIDCTPQKPEIKNETFDRKVDIAGVIGITSKGFTGSVSICFTDEIFLSIMTNMLGEDCTEINSEMEDGAGELLNIIFGHAKKVLNENGFSLEKAIPTIVRGSNIHVKHISSFSSFILPFTTDKGEFYIEISAEN